ncbi:hypothetical protein C4B63_28g214 [Trypanosoma cruzi]|uniref:Uncharacterized protein n=1 Tax=Trypanosoma cruzi TaxID=5693 RepID=A0A2V2VEV0_TRYCR|nr:hypothetical protein C4B63_28g214 [Trypanosoma cruzi]
MPHEFVILPIKEEKNEALRFEKETVAREFAAIQIQRAYRRHAYRLRRWYEGGEKTTIYTSPLQILEGILRDADPKNVSWVFGAACLWPCSLRKAMLRSKLLSCCAGKHMRHDYPERIPGLSSAACHQNSLTATSTAMCSATCERKNGITTTDSK